MWSSTLIRRPISLCGHRGAFSLVEVTFAVGIAAFVLVALLGLMMVGIDASRRASEDTTVAALAGTIIAELRSGDYGTNVSSPPARYFDYRGKSMATTNDAYFRCQIETFPLQTNSFLPGVPSDVSKGVRVRLSFYWPPSKSQPEEIFETTIARY